LSVDFGGVGFFAYVALTTNLAAAAGVLGAIMTSWTNSKTHCINSFA
jgi:ammonia channel protein AmtB